MGRRSSDASLFYGFLFFGGVLVLWLIASAFWYIYLPATFIYIIFMYIKDKIT
jgi:hypothetical protein